MSRDNDKDVAVKDKTAARCGTSVAAVVLGTALADLAGVVEV